MNEFKSGDIKLVRQPVDFFAFFQLYKFVRKKGPLGAVDRHVDTLTGRLPAQAANDTTILTAGKSAREVKPWIDHVPRLDAALTTTTRAAAVTCQSPIRTATPVMPSASLIKAVRLAATTKPR
jgi:hypothetical protein